MAFYSGKMLLDMSGQRIIYLRMSGDRLFPAGSGIYVDIVTGAMTKQPAALPG